MVDQFCRVHLHQIRLHVLDDSLPHSGRQETYDCRMYFRGRGERPTVLSVLRNNFRDLIGQLFLNSPVHFGEQLRTLGDGRRSAVGARTVRHRKAPRQIAQFIHESTVRVSDVESLYELQAWSARRRLSHPICLQAAAISDDQKRTRCHGNHWRRATAHMSAISINKIVARCNIAFARSSFRKQYARALATASRAFFLRGQLRKFDTPLLPRFLASLSLRAADQLKQTTSAPA